METVIKSWVVVGTDPKSRVKGKKPKIVEFSRKYHVKEAADQYAELLRKNGVHDAEVRAVHGVE